MSGPDNTPTGQIRRTNIPANYEIDGTDPTKVNLRVINAGSSGGSTPVTGDVDHDAADTEAGVVKVGGTASANQQVAVDEGDRVQAAYTLNGEVKGAGYDDATNSNRVQEITSLDDITLLNLPTQTTTQTHYVDVREYDTVIVQYVTTNDSLAIEASAQAAVSASSATYSTNFSQYGVEVLDGTTAAASYAATVFLRINTKGITYLRSIITITGGSWSLFVQGAPR